MTGGIYKEVRTFSKRIFYYLHFAYYFYTLEDSVKCVFTSARNASVALGIYFCNMVIITMLDRRLYQEAIIRNETLILQLMLLLKEKKYYVGLLFRGIVSVVLALDLACKRLIRNLFITMVMFHIRPVNIILYCTKVSCKRFKFNSP